MVNLDHQEVSFHSIHNFEKIIHFFSVWMSSSVNAFFFYSQKALKMASKMYLTHYFLIKTILVTHLLYKKEIQLTNLVDKSKVEIPVNFYMALQE